MYTVTVYSTQRVGPLFSHTYPTARIAASKARQFVRAGRNGWRGVRATVSNPAGVVVYRYSLGGN